MVPILPRLTTGTSSPSSATSSLSTGCGHAKLVYTTAKRCKVRQHGPRSSLDQLGSTKVQNVAEHISNVPSCLGWPNFVLCVSRMHKHQQSTITVYSTVPVWLASTISAHGNGPAEWADSPQTVPSLHIRDGFSAKLLVSCPKNTQHHKYS